MTETLKPPKCWLGIPGSWIVNWNKRENCGVFWVEWHGVARLCCYADFFTAKKIGRALSVYEVEQFAKLAGKTVTEKRWNEILAELNNWPKGGTLELTDP